ncbi:MAG: hypothetical protein ACRCX7_13185 [Cetobacterium sp.]|uniref:hypothetical protein n=1 Tax=Cetobacterium sp. TaxID=2071632 RepID=UPI003F408395
MALVVLAAVEWPELVLTALIIEARKVFVDEVLIACSQSPFFLLQQSDVLCQLFVCFLSRICGMKIKQEAKMHRACLNICQN